MTDILFERLLQDPEWRREVLCMTRISAERRWRRRFQDRDFLLWFRPIKEVRAAFDRAVDALPPDIKPANVSDWVGKQIDNHMLSLIEGEPPSPPKWVVKGAKRHGRRRMQSNFRFHGDHGDDRGSSDYVDDREPNKGADVPDWLDDLFVDEESVGPLMKHIKNCDAQFLAVLAGIKIEKHRTALTMLAAGESFGAIRRDTNMRGPDIQAKYILWCQLLGYTPPVFTTP